jgi:cytochrome P450
MTQSAQTAGEQGQDVIDSMESLMKDPANRIDPYPLFRRLREEQPRCLTTRYDTWVLSTHRDAVAVLRDPRLSTSPRHQEGYEQFAAMVRQLGFGPAVQMAEKAVLFLDPPDHTRIRHLVGKAFTPRAVEAMRPHIQEIVDGLLDATEGRGEMDVIADLAYPLPVTVISEMLGVPVEDRDRLQEWTAVAVRLIDPSDDVAVLGEAAQALGGYDEYFRALIADRRTEPRDDLLTALVQAEEEGDRLSEEELLATMALLYLAGHETTVNLIGNGLLALLRHPDEHERLRRDPALLPTAVEEMLRYDSPVQLTGRTATVDVELDGLSIARGQQAIVLLGAANRDPAQFPDPERFDVGRRDNRHVAFGGGIHLCLGAPLARAEAQTAIGSLLRRFPVLRLVDPEPPKKETVNLRGLASLPVSW